MTDRCVKCGREVAEVCGGGYCRDCHVSVSWEDCITGAFEARNNLRLYVSAGVSREEALRLVRKTYPEANLGRGVSRIEL